MKPLTDKQWKRIKSKAPKVPDITCPIIDDVIERIQKHQNKDKVITSHQYNIIVRRMEKLRSDNELLREGGIYWYEMFKDKLKPQLNARKLY